MRGNGSLVMSLGQNKKSNSLILMKKALSLNETQIGDKPCGYIKNSYYICQLYPLCHKVYDMKNFD